MKTITSKTILAVLLFAAVFQSCIKDTVTEKYTFFRPVYKTKEAVINNIKSGTPQAIVQTGKLFLKDELLKNINKALRVGLVKDIYFSDFVMN